MAFVIWITGLPGSGKSTIAKELMKLLKKEKVKASYIPLDNIRKIIIPEPKYTEEEREYVYRAYLLIGKILYENGVNVVLDATANRRRWRDLARNHIKDFFEVYIKCPLRVCYTREKNRRSKSVRRMMYRDALLQKETEKKVDGLGLLPGIDVPYEKPLHPEIVIESNKHQPAESADKILKFIKNKITF